MCSNSAWFEKCAAIPFPQPNPAALAGGCSEDTGAHQAAALPHTLSTFKCKLHAVSVAIRAVSLTDCSGRSGGQQLPAFRLRYHTELLQLCSSKKGTEMLQAVLIVNAGGLNLFSASWFRELQQPRLVGSAFRALFSAANSLSGLAVQELCMHDASFFVATLKMADTEPSDMDGGNSHPQGHGRDTMTDRVLLLSAVMLERPRHAGERLLGSHLARAMVKAFYHQFPQEVHNSLLFSLKRHAVFHNTIPGVVLSAARGAADELAGGTPGLVQVAVVTHGHMLIHAHGPHHAPLAAALTLGPTCLGAEHLAAQHTTAKPSLQVNTEKHGSAERHADMRVRSEPLLSLNWSQTPDFAASVALAASSAFEAAAAPCTSHCDQLKQ